MTCSLRRFVQARNCPRLSLCHCDGHPHLQLEYRCGPLRHQQVQRPALNASWSSCGFAYACLLQTVRKTKWLWGSCHHDDCSGHNDNWMMSIDRLVGITAPVVVAITPLLFCAPTTVVMMTTVLAMVTTTGSEVSGGEVRRPIRRAASSTIPPLSCHRDNSCRHDDNFR